MTTVVEFPVKPTRRIEDCVNMTDAALRVVFNEVQAAFPNVPGYSILRLMAVIARGMAKEP